MVHVVASDHAGRIGKAVGVPRVGGTQQDCGTVDRARRQHEEIAPDLRAVDHLGGLDAPAARIGEQADNLCSRPQADSIVAQHRVDQPGFGVALGAQAAGEAVAGIAAHTGAALVVLHRRGDRKRAQALEAQALGDLGDHRIVAQRRMRIRAGAGRLRRVDTGLAVHTEEMLGAGVVGLQRVVVDGPGRRQPALVFDGAKILAPEAEHGGAEHLRVAADIVELARPKGPSAAVGPSARPTCRRHRRRPPRGPSCGLRAAAAIRARGSRCGRRWEPGYGPCSRRRHRIQ